MRMTVSEKRTIAVREEEYEMGQGARNTKWGKVSEGLREVMGW